MTLTEKDIDEIEKRLSSVFATKEEFVGYKDQILNKLDEFLGEIKDGREEQTLLSHRVSDHEDRIEKIEGKLRVATV